jgi:hypothetical protein
MGKLHKIRRSIERDPAAWFGARAVHPSTVMYVGAIYLDGSWRPSFTGLNGRYYGASYMAFVQHVRREIGIPDPGP